jgi:hypothetical protein
MYNSPPPSTPPLSQRVRRLIFVLIVLFGLAYALHALLLRPSIDMSIFLI